MIFVFCQVTTLTQALGSLKVANAQISSSYVCMVTNAVGSAMARSEVIVVASKEDAA